jgi:hypothetical protein
MFGVYFYHERLRKSVAIFGRLFNEMYVLRKNSSGETISQVKVPLSYAPKQKFLERIRSNPDLNQDQSVAVKLPRMSFELLGITYDTTRQLPKINNYINSGTTNNTRNKIYSYVPYTLNFQLSIYAKNQDDALQLVEQILPRFNPTYTLTLSPLSNLTEIKEDVPITIAGVTFTDDFEGPVEQRRTIIYTLDFEMKANFYGPIAEQGIVRTSINNFYQIGSGLLDSDQLLETLTVTPDPTDVSPDSDYGFNETIDYSVDSA